MREACGGQAVRLGAKSLAHAKTLAQGVGGWGVAPSARSTPTRAQRGTRPKKLQHKHLLTNLINMVELFVYLYVLQCMRSLRALNPYLWKYKKYLLSGLAFVMLSAWFATLPAQIIRNALDMVKDELYILRLCQNFTAYPDFYPLVQKTLLLAGGVILSFAIIRGCFLFLTRQTLIVMSRRIEFDLKNDIFNHLQTLSTDFYRKYSTGDILARIGEDVSRVRMYLGPAIMYTASTVTMFVFVLATMLSVNVWLTLIVIIPLPILSISIYYVNTSVNKRSERVQNQLSTLSTFVQ
ncbi:MAG: ABC transporter transmembrane domain-containing protein, partial [Bacteroidia bacterium]|nr:ABC transporter transmembrane domain-containing protein [Bacteroidia bacterium]